MLCEIQMNVLGKTKAQSRERTITNVSGWNITFQGPNIILLDDVKGKEKWEPYWDALMSLDGGTFG